MDLPHLFHSCWGHILPDKDLTQNQSPTGKYILYVLYVYIVSPLQRKAFTFHPVSKCVNSHVCRGKAITSDLDFNECSPIFDSLHVQKANEIRRSSSY